MNLEIGTYLRPFFGERVIGDAIVTSSNADISYLVVIDGIGHGVRAGHISSPIERFIKNNWIPNPSELISKTHHFMKGTDGAVIGVAVVNHKERTLTYSGLGNITCRIFGDKNKLMVSADGLLGVRKRTVNNDVVNLKNNDIIVIHSDGVSSTTEFNKFLNKGLPPRVLAKKIVTEFGSEFDDSSCLVAKCKER